jgi:hypothetical protein
LSQCLTEHQTTKTNVLLSYAPRREDVLGRGGLVPRILNVGTLLFCILQQVSLPLTSYFRADSSLRSLQVLSCSRNIRLLWNSRIYYRLHSVSSLEPIPSHNNPIHTPTPKFFMVKFNTYAWYSKRSLLFRYSN